MVLKNTMSIHLYVQNQQSGFVEMNNPHFGHIYLVNMEVLNVGVRFHGC